MLSGWYRHSGGRRLATVGAAAAAGADVANYVRLVALEQARGSVRGALLQGLPDEGAIAVRTRAVVNATGPWVDEVRRLEDPGANPLVRLSKGVNLFLRFDGDWSGALALFDRTRSVVAVPWHGLLLVGATDTPFDDDPGTVAPDPEDVEQLLGSLRDVLPEELLRPDRVLAATAGLRALERRRGSTASAARDELISVGPAGVVSVAGGKLTTHRLIAVATLAALPVEVRPRGLRPTDAPVAQRWRPTAAGSEIDPATLEYLVSLYGGAASELIGSLSGLEAVAAGGPDVRAQLTYARDAEWAFSVDDVVRRRTTLELRGLATPELRTRIADELELPQLVAVGSDPFHAQTLPAGDRRLAAGAA